MIFGTGIDIVDIDRVAEKVSGNSAFQKKVFSESEIAYCEKCYNKPEHYAARFAAKEAFLKATGLGLSAGTNLFEIEIVNDETGKPFFRFHGSFADLVDKRAWKKIHLSMSHTNTSACAMVIIES